LDKVVEELIKFKRENPTLLFNSERNLKLIKKYFRKKLTAKDVNCGRGIRDMLISNNGDVTTCFDSLGNIRNNSLNKIWNSKEAEIAREKVRNCPTPCILPCFVE